MKQYTIEQVKAVLAAHNMVFFENHKWDLNIIAIRSKNSQSNKYDDILMPIWRGDDWKMASLWLPCTTDPGKHWLMNPLNLRGTLITKPGQYRGALKMGFHNRSKGPDRMYRAFEQCKPFDYVRDNNRDSKLDFSLFDDPKNIIRGVFKTNIHRASKYRLLPTVDKYSAGCCVTQDPEHHDQLIWLGDRQIHAGLGDTYTYTLLEEKWFDELGF